VVGDEGFQAAGALFLRPFDNQLQGTGTSSSRARSAVMWATLALQSAVPRPYQRPSFSVSSNTVVPGGVVQWWLDIVVRVEQHGGSLRVRAVPRPHHREAPVGGFFQADVGEAEWPLQ